jgi:putative serine protease PepD
MASPPNHPNDSAPAGHGPDADTRPLRPGAPAPPEPGTTPAWVPPPSWGTGGPGDAPPAWTSSGGGDRGDPPPAWTSSGGGDRGDAPPAWTSAGAGPAGAAPPGDSPLPGGAGPGWGARPPGAGDAPRRRGGAGRAIALTVAALLLILTGAGLTLLVDRRDPAAVPAGAGIPAPAAAAPLPAGEEPVAAVARILGPSVVQIETGQGLGSGVIYDKNGFILTAAHVVEGVSSVTIRFQDGSTVRGRVLGIDSGNDVAVVKADRSGLKPATLARNVKLQVGQTAVAIGSPFGLQQTVTAGVVSATNRSLRTPNSALEVIQTDAPINPGNSGGALADRAGRVIGINDSIRSQSGGNEGVGFAIPIDTAANSAARIVRGERIRSGYLGVGVSSPALGKAGALIGQVESGSPAEKAGIRVGDLVTEIDGEAIKSGDDLAARARQGSPGQQVRVKLERDGRQQTITVTLAERPGQTG